MGILNIVEPCIIMIRLIQLAFDIPLVTGLSAAVLIILLC